MIPTTNMIKAEIIKMEKYREDCDDDITDRMLYTVSEILRWCVEDTKGWQKPLRATVANAEILKEDLMRKITAKTEKLEANHG